MSGRWCCSDVCDVGPSLSRPALLARFTPFVNRPENTVGEVDASDVAERPKGFQDIGIMGRLRGRGVGRGAVAVGGGRRAGVAKGKDDADVGVNKGAFGIG